MFDENSGPVCHLLIISDNRLLAEAIGSALCEKSEFTSFESVRCGDEHSHLCKTQHEPQAVIIDACCMADTAEKLQVETRRQAVRQAIALGVLQCQAAPALV